MAMTSSNHGDIDIHVTVKTSELLERLKANRKKHAQEFEAAILVWQEDLAAAMNSLDPSQSRSYPKVLRDLETDCPESHVDEYDQAIDMFTMCTKDEIKLDSEAFNTFCRDDWGWKSYVSQNRYYTRSSLAR